MFGSIEDLDRISREDFDSQQSILMATVHFQRQAQEFNQVLLRGDDPAALDKSWASFEASERAAAEEARLARSSSPHKEVRDAVEAFLAEHKAAGETYRRGLEAFKAAKADPRAGERAVTGVDRQPDPDDPRRREGRARPRRGCGGPRREERGQRVPLRDRGDGDRDRPGHRGRVVLRAPCGALPIDAAVGFAERIAGGDLTADIRSRARDEAGQLLRSLAIMKESLADVVTQRARLGREPW